MVIDGIDLSVQAYANAKAYVVDARRPTEGLFVVPYDAAAMLFPTSVYGELVFEAGKLNIVAGDYSGWHDITSKINSGNAVIQVPQELPLSLADRIKELPINNIVAVRHVLK